MVVLGLKENALGLGKSPLWNLPFNFGEDIIHKIHHEAVMKQINSIEGVESVGVYYSCEVPNELGIAQIPCGLKKYPAGYFMELREVPIRDSNWDLYSFKYTEKDFRQEDNSIESHFPDYKTSYTPSLWFYREYKRKQARIHNIKEFGKRYKENRIRRKILNYKEYRDVDKNIIECKKMLVWRIRKEIKEDFNNYYTFKYIQSKKQCIRRLYRNEVDTARINQLERYKKLITEVPKYKYQEEEKMYYLIQASFLKYPNTGETELQQSTEYTKLGTLRSHLQSYKNYKFIIQNKFLDALQYIYVVNKYFKLTRWDIYSEAFKKKYRKYKEFKNHEDITQQIW